MSLLTVQQSIEWYDESSTWGGAQSGFLAPFTEQEKVAILNDLSLLYTGSDSARAALESLSTSGIKLARSSGAGSFTSPDFSFVSYNQDDDVVWLNKHGSVVQAPHQLILLHELLHMHLRVRDTPVEDSVSDQNSASFDFSGPVVNLQNEIALQLGWGEKQSVSYLMHFDREAAQEDFAWTVGANYAQGQEIDVARTGEPGNDFIDMRPKGASRDLIFGHTGDDVIYGGDGDDVIYGDRVDDTGIYGGRDQLFGGDGKDHLFGGDGADDLDGGIGNDRLRGGSGADYIDGGIGSNILFGDDGADKLISRGMGDVLAGGGGNDIIELRSAAATLVFGAGDGSDLVDFVYGDGTYALNLVDLSPDDVEVFAGGRDIYNPWWDESRSPGLQYQFIGVRIKSTGDQITLLENGRNIGPDGNGDDISYNRGYWTSFAFGEDWEGIYPGEGKLDSVHFADGTIWDQHEFWRHISVNDTWGYDFDYAGQWSDSTYLNHVTSTYLQADADYATGRAPAAGFAPALGGGAVEMEGSTLQLIMQSGQLPLATGFDGSALNLHSFRHAWAESWPALA